jgi:alkanesulfonate monooxygenase SsuD/methylene tetrahydromethanopterin reductase-like flavin-dependent oxidoreductase (luciferase family)
MELGRLGVWSIGIRQVAEPAVPAAAGFEQLEQVAPGRFLLGLGVSHAPMVNHGAPGRYRRPLQAMADYLDELTAVPRDRRVLAALGLKMLGGATPVPLPERRAIAREVLPAWPGHLWAGPAGQSGRSTTWARTVVPSADSQPRRPA